LEISEEEIQKELERRKGGKNPYTTPRAEKDRSQILSGLFEGKTTGAPLAIVIENGDVDSSTYEPIKELLRPGHANFTYLEKYGIFDYRGGGRASARETAVRVAAGAVAKKILSYHQIKLLAYVKEIGGIAAPEVDLADFDRVKEQIEHSPLFCPDPDATAAMAKKIEEVKREGDSLGGIIEMVAISLPVGLGDPIYEKLEANLAKAMLTLPATKGIEFGSGFQAARMRGSQHNDTFAVASDGKIVTQTNHAGGTLGGISTSMPLILRVAFKPTSSILKPQKSLDLKKEAKAFQMPEGSRHDPCVTPRAVPIVEAMGALVLVDALLMQRCARL
jgi:chorismate synthase